MDISEAWDILHKHFSDSFLRDKYRAEGFDKSESDTIEELKYNGKLLRDKAMKITDSEEKDRLYKAAKAFEDMAVGQFWGK